MASYLSYILLELITHCSSNLKIIGGTGFTFPWMYTNEVHFQSVAFSYPHRKWLRWPFYFRRLCILTGGTDSNSPTTTDNCTLLSWGIMLLIVLNRIPRSVAVRHSEHQKGRRALLHVQWKSPARNLIHSWLVFDGCKIMSWGSFSCLCFHLPHSALPRHNQ